MISAQTAGDGYACKSARPHHHYLIYTEGLACSYISDSIAFHRSSRWIISKHFTKDDLLTEGQVWDYLQKHINAVG